MANELTRLERVVLEAISQRQEMSGLADALPSARVTRRDNTGHGFYTHFEVTQSAIGKPGLPWMTDGPYARVKVASEEVLMGFILWGPQRGGPTLEGFQYGNDVDLHEYDLAALQIAFLEWTAAS
jgi:hypothetical protein